MEYVLYTFESTSFAEACKIEVQSHDIDARLVPVFGAIKAGCGLMLKSPFENLEKINEIIKENDLKIDGIYKAIYSIDKGCAFKPPTIEVIE